MSDAPRTSNLNVPNALTTLRILMVPFFGWALLVDGGDSITWRLVAFGIFVAAMITDKIDGDLARKHNLITNFGKIADPIADKALIGSALIGLSMLGDLPWWITVVILVRELGITLLRLAVLRHGVIPASRGGKLKTLVQAVAIGLFVLPLAAWPGPWLSVAWAIMVAAVALTLVTGLDYVLSAIRDSRGRPAAH